MSNDPLTFAFAVWPWLSARKQARAIATEWHRIGSLPLRFMIGAIAVWFDGERVKLQLRDVRLGETRR